MHIVYVYANSSEEWNSAEWRCAIPARAIQRSRLHTAQLLDIQSFAQNTPQAQKACLEADVIVIQRDLFGPVLNPIQRWKARDKIVIADFDDAYQLMPATDKDYHFWVEGKRNNKGLNPPLLLRSSILRLNPVQMGSAPGTRSHRAFCSPGRRLECLHRGSPPAQLP